MRYALVDYRISKEELINLENLSISPILCPKSQNVYEAIDGHPDIQIHILNNRDILLSKDINADFVNKLNTLGFKVYFSEMELKNKYPYDIILNAVNLDKYFIHRLDSTDKNLLNFKKDKVLINTKQGYTKCSTAVVSGKAIITSDKAIIKALYRTNIDCLYIRPGHIILPGLDYGFIGGTCGLIDEHILAFFGELSYHPDYELIISFLKKHEVEPVYLRKGPLIDRGSLFILNSKQKWLRHVL